MNMLLLLQILSGRIHHTKEADLDYVKKEYALIMQKKSKLSRSQRNRIIYLYKSEVEV